MIGVQSRTARKKSLTSSFTIVPAQRISSPGIRTCQGNSLWLAFLLSGLYTFEKYGIEFCRKFICNDLLECRSHFLSWLLLNRIVRCTNSTVRKKSPDQTASFILNRKWNRCPHNWTITVIPTYSFVCCVTPMPWPVYFGALIVICSW